MPLSSFSQQSTKLRRIGFLAMRSPPSAANPDYYGAFVWAMRELGYIEGKNILIEWRAAEGNYERLPVLAAELVQMNVELIVTHATPGTRAAQQATRTIPIVTAAVTDPVGDGFAVSLARPGGNVTGLSLIILDISPKHMELLKTMVPKLSHVAVLVNPDNPSIPGVIKSIRAAAGRIGVKVSTANARSPVEVEQAFAAITRERAQAVIVASDAFLIGQRRLIASLILKHRMPSISANRDDVEAGGLMSYGQNATEFYRRAAAYVDKILKGAKPADLPFEQPTRFDLVINRKTATALGLTIPTELLVRGGEVLE